VPASSDTKLVTSYGYKADEVQTITLTGNPSSGNFKLTFDGYQTGEISETASASAVRSALTGLTSIGTGNVMVTGPNGGPWTVRFISNKAEQNLPAITDDDTAVSTVTAADGGDNGRLQKVIDPRGLIAKTDYDLKGRSVRTIENYDNFSTSDIDDRTTEFAYDGNDNLTLLTAVLPSNAYQKTQYVYGVTTSTGSALYSNDLLRQVKYPDKSSGDPSTESADYELFEYNALGETTELTDRNQTVRSFSYDVVGRPTKDVVDTLGSGVDSGVRRLETAYDTFGRPYLFTSYSAASGGSVVNQVKHEFNGLSQLTNDWQSHSGTVGGSTPKVQYAYSDMSDNHSRLATITYPNGRVLRYEYDTDLDSDISRVTFLADDDDGDVGTVLEEYSYLGLATPIMRARPEPDMDLTYIKRSAENVGDAGDQYTGLDRFGRVVDQRWRRGNTATHADRFKYGYDRNSNRLYRDNLLDDDFDELYHANGPTNGYDGFNQIKEFRRGPLSDGSTPADGIPDTVTTASRSQVWSLDVMGNWASLTNDGGSAVNRTHNKRNQVTQVGSSSVTFDSNGNTTAYTDGSSKSLTYDAWNRVIQITGGASTVTYAYDALGHRVKETRGSTTTDLYYSDDWQVLEEREGSSEEWQYVWSQLYVDALILAEDLNVLGGFGDDFGGGGDDFGDDPEPGTQRLYVQQDANWNVTALVDGNPLSQTLGDVLERYIYDPFGQPTILDPSWNTRSASEHDWRYLHQGGRYDEVVNLYHFRNRDLSPALGRWLQTDPLSYAAGDTNLYRDVGNNPGNALDPSGLMKCMAQWCLDIENEGAGDGSGTGDGGSNVTFPAPMIDGAGGNVQDDLIRGNPAFFFPRPSCMICHGRPEVLLNGDLSNLSPGERMAVARWMNGSYGSLGLWYGVAEWLDPTPATGVIGGVRGAVKGDPVEAGTGALAMIPVFGKLGKVAGKGAKLLDKGGDAARSYKTLLPAAKKEYPKLAGVKHNHHVVPRYLGGAKNGNTVEMDAAYHQWITNEFRNKWAYGQGKPSPKKLEEIMTEVYKKYPLPPK
jgi:RHS repeat-associated protein